MINAPATESRPGQLEGSVPRSAASKIGSFAVGTVGSAALGFAIVPLIAWMFAPDEIGRYALLQSFVALSSLVGPAGFDHYYMRMFHGSADRRLLLSQCFISSLALTAVAVVLLSTSSILSQGSGPLGHIFSTDDQLTLQMIISCVAAGVLIRYWSIIPRMEGRGFVYSMGQTMPKVVLVSMLVLSGVLGQLTFEFLVLAVFVSQAITLLSLWPFVRSSFSKTGLRPFGVRALPGIGGYTVPIVFGTIIVWVMSFFDRTLLRLLSTFDELALYSVAASIAAAAGVLQMLFSTLWAPAIYEAVTHDEERAKHLTRVGIETVYIVIGAAFCLAGLLSPLVRLVVPGEFAAASYLVPACLSLPLLYVLGECTVIGAYVVQRTLKLMLASLAAGLTSLAVNFWLIEARGATGAAVALVISSTVYFLCRTEVSVRTWFRFPRVEMYLGVLSFAVLSIAHAIHGHQHATELNLAWLVLFTYVLMRASRSTTIRQAARQARVRTELAS